MEYNKRIYDMCLGDEFAGYYVITNIQLKGSKGKTMLLSVLSDSEDSINANMRDYTGPLASADSGKAVYVQGEVTEYHGGLQVSLRQLRPGDERDAGKYRISDLVPSVQMDLDAALQDVQAMLNSVEDEDYRKIGELMLARHQAAFSSIPAGKRMHHWQLGGLLMHTVNMMRSADFLSDLYYYVINRSLLLVGTLLHDMAKQEEFTFSELGLVNGYSVSGDLLGHLYLGAREVHDVCRELAVPEEKAILLEHLLLSHHGEPEWGACRRPICAEAELLSILDKLDSRMEIFAEACEKTPLGEVSGVIPAIDKRVYNHYKPE
ncbi:MAG: HD domain-containing protein [Oscillospiraceae bacterium]|nr:HD domain-containing protein [Oscillospiraceae bacterium]